MPQTAQVLPRPRARLSGSGPAFSASAGRPGSPPALRCPRSRRAGQRPRPPPAGHPARRYRCPCRTAGSAGPRSSRCRGGHSAGPKSPACLPCPGRCRNTRRKSRQNSCRPAASGRKRAETRAAFFSRARNSPAAAGSESPPASAGTAPQKTALPARARARISVFLSRASSWTQTILKTESIRRGCSSPPPARRWRAAAAVPGTGWCSSLSRPHSAPGAARGA